MSTKQPVNENLETVYIQLMQIPVTLTPW